MRSIFSSDMENLLKSSISCKGNLTIVDGAPQIPEDTGYYICTTTYINHYTNESAHGILVYFKTPGRNQYMQVIITSTLNIYIRYLNNNNYSTEPFTNINEYNIQLINDTKLELIDLFNSIFVVSANLFDASNILNNKMLLDDGSISNVSGCYCTNYFIPVEPGTYKWTYNNKLCIVTYDENKNPVVASNNANNDCRFEVYATAYEYHEECQITFTSEVKYIKLCTYLGEFNDGFMFVRGELPDSYVPNKIIKNWVLPWYLQSINIGGIYYSSDSSATSSDTDTSVNGSFYFYLPYGGNGKYIKIDFIHSIRPDYSGTGTTTYKNGDVFRLNHGVIGNIEYNTFTPNTDAVESGAWEAAIYENNSGSAVGTFHGYEKFNKCIIQVNGTTIADYTRTSVAIPDIPITPADTIEIFYYSDVYRQLTEGDTTPTKILSAFRHYLINKDGIYLKQKNTWLNAGTHGIFVAMGCISRALTDSAICDYDYKIYNISNQNVTELSHSGSPKQNVSYAKVYGSNTNVGMSIYVNPSCNFYIQNTAGGAYNKMYFRYVKDTKACETWTNETYFTFTSKQFIFNDAHEYDEINAKLDAKIDATEYRSLIPPTSTYDSKLYDGTPTLVDGTIYKACKYTNLPEAGSRMYIEGMQASNNYRLYRIYNSKDQIIGQSSVDITGSGARELYFTLPRGASYIWTNGYRTKYGLYVINYENNINTLISNKMDGLKQYTLKTPLETKENYLFKSDNTLVEYNNYIAIKYAVTPGEKIKIIGCQPASTNLLYNIFNILDSRIDDSANIIETGNGKKEIEITVPYNASYIWINTYYSYLDNGIYDISYNTDASSILQNINNGALFVETTSTGCYVSIGDFKFYIRKVGANNLMNIYSGYYKGTLLFATNTDWIGPYNFYKTADANGDYGTGGTTGGNHAFKYNETDSDYTVKTAYTVSYEIIADGVEVTSGSKYCNTLEIRWVNKVMASNTVKRDGTGEYCLEEHIRLTIDSTGAINVDAYFTPLVDCMLNWYSGIQYAGSQFASKAYIQEYSDSVINISDINSNANGSTAVVSRYKTIGDVASCEMWIDRTYGFGKHNDKQSVTGNASKSYFILQSYNADDMPIYAGNRYYWRGGYKFYKSI